MKPAFSLRVYILRRGRAAVSFLLEPKRRFYRTLWEIMEGMETTRRAPEMSIVQRLVLVALPQKHRPLGKTFGG
jgi:hypothetical protein